MNRSKLLKIINFSFVNTMSKSFNKKFLQIHGIELYALRGYNFILFVCRADFLARILHILRSSLDGLLATAEVSILVDLARSC